MSVSLSRHAQKTPSPTTTTNHHHHKLLSKLEVIEEDIAANLQVATEESYATYLQQLYKTLSLRFNREVDCAEKTVFWSEPRLSDKTA